MKMEIVLGTFPALELTLLSAIGKFRNAVSESHHWSLPQMTSQAAAAVTQS